MPIRPAASSPTLPTETILHDRQTLVSWDSMRWQGICFCTNEQSHHDRRRSYRAHSTPHHERRSMLRGCLGSCLRIFQPLEKGGLGHNAPLRTRVSQLGPNFTDLRRRFLYKNQYIAAMLGGRSWRTRWVKRNGRRMTLCRENGRRWPFGGRRPSFAAQIVGDWPVPCGPFVKFVGVSLRKGVKREIPVKLTMPNLGRASVPVDAIRFQSRLCYV